MSVDALLRSMPLAWVLVCGMFFVACMSDTSPEESHEHAHELSQEEHDAIRISALRRRIDGAQSLHWNARWLWYLDNNQALHLQDCLALIANPTMPERIRIGATRTLAYAAKNDGFTAESADHLQDGADALFELARTTSDRLSAYVLVSWIELHHTLHGLDATVHALQSKINIESWPNSGDEYLLGAHLYILARLGLIDPTAAQELYLELYEGDRSLELIRQASPVFRSLRRVRPFSASSHRLQEREDGGHHQQGQ